MPGLIFTTFKNFITSNFDAVTLLNVKKSAQLNFDDNELNLMFDDKMGILIVNTLSAIINIEPHILLNQMGIFLYKKQYKKNMVI